MLQANITLSVADMARATAFYERLGFMKSKTALRAPAASA